MTWEEFGFLAVSGGIDLDVITANPADVRAGKVIVNKDGDPLTGTLPDWGSWGVVELAAGASVTIPSGIHDGTGKIVTKSLADQTPGNLAAGNMLSGAYGYSNGVRVNGGIASMGAQSVVPGAAVQKVSCRGKYMTGDVTVQAVAGLTAANIKKGVIVGGVKGTWEGYVAEATDLYNNGAIGSYGLTASKTNTEFNSNSISWYGSDILYTTKAINLTGYTGVEIVLANNTTSTTSKGDIYLRAGSTAGATTIGYVKEVGLGKPNAKVTIKIPFSANHAFTSALGLNLTGATGSIVTTVYKISLY